MTPKPGPHLELIEPIRSFLESFTQELTEQQFIPAFRDELHHLVTSLDGLKESEDTLQQIARGVDRLREVFAPAGNRMLEGVKGLEAVMQENATGLKEHAYDILKDLIQTHSQLETALRNEAGLLQEHTSASRDALARTVADIEERLNGLTGQIEHICQRAESEISGLSTISAKNAGVSQVAAQVANPALSIEPVIVHLPDELKELILRTEETVTKELSKHKSEIRSALQLSAHDNQDRLSKLHKSVNEALSNIGPRVQEELDTTLTRLRDQIQNLALIEAENISSRTTTPTEGEAGESVSGSVIKATIAGSENRLLHELADMRKAQRHELTVAGRALRSLINGFQTAADKQSEKLVSDSQEVAESLQKLQEQIADIQSHSHQTQKSLLDTRSTVEQLLAAQGSHNQQLADGLQETLARLENQKQTLENKLQRDATAFDLLTAQLARAEKAATSATDVALTDSRSQRERIEIGLKDLRERLETGLSEKNEQVTDALQKITISWTEELQTLKDAIHEQIATTSETLSRELAKLEKDIKAHQQAGAKREHDVQSDMKRTADQIGERIENLQTNSDTFTASIEKHVQVVSSEVAGLRSSQEKSLSVLKEAIRANYDDNAAKLKEILDGAMDSLIKQISIVPQTLERYAHLAESLHQSEQFALQAIASDTKNVLALVTDHYTTISADNGAMKKYFPLLDKKLEKQTSELDGLRKAQWQQDKELAELKKSLLASREQLTSQGTDFKGQLKDTLAHQQSGFEETKRSVEVLSIELRSLQETDLPTFRRELSSLIGSKFEFMETTLAERQETLRKELTERMEKESAANRRANRLLSLLVLLALTMEITLLLK